MIQLDLQLAGSSYPPYQLKFNMASIGLIHVNLYIKTSNLRGCSSGVGHGTIDITPGSRGSGHWWRGSTMWPGGVPFWLRSIPCPPCFGRVPWGKMRKMKSVQTSSLLRFVCFLNFGGTQYLGCTFGGLWCLIRILTNIVRYTSTMRYIISW